MTHALAHLPITDIEPKVRAAISRTQGGRIIDEPANAPLDFDSLTTVEITIEIEDEFDIDISDADLEGFSGKSVADWVEFVSQQLTK